MTSTSVPLTGSIVALITPMQADGSVDYGSLRKLIDWHIAEGTNCIGVVGTSGESPTVTVEEHMEIIRVAVEQADKRVPIMAGCGANSTHEAITLAKYAKSVGADSQLQVVPYYNKPTQEGQYQHFKAIAEAVGDLPIFLYNVPGRTVADMQYETVLRLAELPGIVGIKEATGNIERAQWLIKDAPANFGIYSGDDPTAVALMLCGGHGNVSVTANVAPRLMSQLCEAVAALCQFAVVRDHHKGGTLLAGELHHQRKHGVGGGAVQVASGLVRQHAGRAGDQGAGDGHALALAARQLGGAVVQAFAQPHGLEYLRGGLGTFGGGRPADTQGHTDVVECTEFGQQVVELVDKAQVLVTQAALRGGVHLGDVLAQQLNAAGGGGIEPTHQVQQGAFARTGRADDSQRFARMHIQVHAVQHGEVDAALMEAFGQAAHLEHGVTHISMPLRG